MDPKPSVLAQHPMACLKPGICTKPHAVNPKTDRPEDLGATVAGADIIVDRNRDHRGIVLRIRNRKSETPHPQPVALIDPCEELRKGTLL